MRRRPLYRIGLFSKINRITPKTLRHYDEIGLLKPDCVDHLTGYRFYSSRQLPRLHRILALRQLGLGLKEIKEIVESPEAVREALKIREEESARRIREEREKLSRIRSWLDRLDRGEPEEYAGVVRSLPGAVVASMRVKAASYDDFFSLVPPMGREMERQGAVCSEPASCFTIFHDGEYKEEEIDAEICEAVLRPCEDSAMVRYKTLPAVTEALCVLHRGPYSAIRGAYAFAYRWIDENPYRPAGLPRESYIDGIWNKEDPREWLTELQIPLESAADQPGRAPKFSAIK